MMILRVVNLRTLLDSVLVRWLWVKALDAKPNDVSSSLGTHVIGEHRLLKIVPSSTHSLSVCAHMNKYIILKETIEDPKKLFMLIIYL